MRAQFGSFSLFRGCAKANGYSSSLSVEPHLAVFLVSEEGAQTYCNRIFLGFCEVIYYVIGIIPVT